MFGWEYPPQITGGLGTACQGLAEALAERGVDVVMVLPVSPFTHEEEAERLRVLGANRVSVPRAHVHGAAERLSYLPVDSLLTPYLNPESYEARHQKFVERQATPPARPEAPPGQTVVSYRRSGGYGVALPAIISVIALETTVLHLLLSGFGQPSRVWNPELRSALFNSGGYVQLPSFPTKLSWPSFNTPLVMRPSNCQSAEPIGEFVALT
jgi:hypothetical protein